MTAGGDTPPKKPRRGRRPKVVEPNEIAAILAYASLHDDKAAAGQFKVSPRTIQRWRSALRAGSLPEVAKLVATQRTEAIERNQDLLVETLDKFLRQLQTKVEGFTNEELIDGCKMLGELRQGRDFLNEDVDGPRPNQPSARDEAPAGGAQGRTRKPASGADAGRGDGESVRH